MNGNEQVAARIQQLQSEAADEAATDAAWILKQVRRVYEAAMQAGKFTAANRALELLGKNVGLFVDRLQLDSERQGQVVIYLPDNGRDCLQGPNLPIRTNAIQENNGNGKHIENGRHGRLDMATKPRFDGGNFLANSRTV